MDELTFLENIDWYEWFIIFVTITLAVKFLYKTYIEDIIIKHGWESAKMRQKREDHELLIKTSQGLLALQEKHNADESKLENSLTTFIEEQKKENDKLRNEMRQYTENRINDRKQSLQIQKELKESIQGLISGQNDRDRKIEALTSLFVDKEIEDLRWTILDFTASLSDGKKYNRESFDHIMRMYHKYEKILEENNMENGLVEESVKFIQEVYHEKLKTGFN